MSNQPGGFMDEIRQLEARIITLEHRAQGHADSILILHKRTDDNTAILNKIQNTLSKLLWTAIGFCLYYSASTLGFLEALRLMLI